MKRRPIEERFWAKVDKLGPIQPHAPHLGACWQWTAALYRDGYGAFATNRRVGRAHRFSWRLHYGEPGALCVCHHCDNKRCVNPSHLFLGTVRDNVRDMREKGRARNVGAPRIPDATILLVFSDYRRGVSQREISEKYGIANSHVCMLLHGQRRQSTLARLNLEAVNAA